MYYNARVNIVNQKILPSVRDLLKRAQEARGPYCIGRHARENLAQGSRSSLAAFPPRRGFGGAAYENSDYLVGGAARTRTAGRAAGPEGGPCATPHGVLMPADENAKGSAEFCAPAQYSAVRRSGSPESPCAPDHARIRISPVSNRYRQCKPQSLNSANSALPALWLTSS